jgi:hypothetical protein
LQTSRSAWLPWNDAHSMGLDGMAQAPPDD